MERFTIWTARAVPFDQANIDTNQLCPTRFNKVAKGPDYARVLFHDLRFDAEGAEKPAFVLNLDRFRNAGILVADRNFGCGSSRESAVYALHAYGFRAIIAPSFGEIFQRNCFKNGVLPVELDDAACAAIRQQLHARGGELTVDLQNEAVRDVEGKDHRFKVHPLRKRCLLEGLDDISLTGQFEEVIAPFEASYRAAFPWLARGQQAHSA